VIRYDSDLPTTAFIGLALRVWPRGYDSDAVAAALGRTTNIAAWDGERLVGAVRVLDDGYLFATVPEVLVDPGYRLRGVGRELMRRAVAAAPGHRLFLGAQPDALVFFQRLGARPGPTGLVLSEQKPRCAR
jgi:GNAT superfamily N-acetyltransferase